MLSGKREVVTVIGHQPDVAAVSLLFSSLLVQATRAITAPAPPDGAWAHSQRRSYRHSYWLSFAWRIGQRLRTTRTIIEREVGDSNGKDLVPILAVRSAAVDDAVSELFPRLRNGRGPRASNPEGCVAGRAAADLASLHPLFGVLHA